MLCFFLVCLWGFVLFCLLGLAFWFFFCGVGLVFCILGTRSIVPRTPGKGPGSCSSGKREALKRSPDVVSREKAV